MQNLDQSSVQINTSLSSDLGRIVLTGGASGFSAETVAQLLEAVRAYRP